MATAECVLKGCFDGVIFFMLRLVYQSINFIGRIILKIFGERVADEKEYLPPIGPHRCLLRKSVTEIADKVRTQEITAEQVVRAFITRIFEVNPTINSVVSERLESAIEEARGHDRLIQCGYYDVTELETKFPLLGVPFTVKDTYSVNGLKQTAGLYSRKDVIATEDADVVKKLRNAGAILLGVTNVSELGIWWETVNSIYGRSNNPYDPRCTTGGSSGGEAALQACAGSGFGIGADVGGSVRIPALFCGIFGHKATPGLISFEGHEPRPKGRICDFLSVGTLVRHAKDLKFLFRVIVDDQKWRSLTPTKEIKNIRVFWMEDDGGNPLMTPVSEELRISMHAAVGYLTKKHGIIATKIEIPKLYHSLWMWISAMSVPGGNVFCEELGMRQREVNPFWEIMKCSLGLSHHTLPALVSGLLEKIAHLSRNFSIHKELLQMGHELSNELQELLGDDGILLYPSHPTTAPRHQIPMCRPFDFSYTAIFNIIGLPVVQVPLGLSWESLPLGMQIVGGRFNDLLLLRVAEEIEVGFGGWVPPCVKKKLGQF